MLESKICSKLQTRVRLKCRTLCITENKSVGCLENYFTAHDLRDKSHEWRIDVRVKDLLEATDKSPPESVGRCALQKTRVLGVWKTISQPMTYATKAMNGG
jgi:hypothetical protein